MKQAEWYVKEVAKLFAIALQDPDDGDGTMHKQYLNEKLERILNGIGIRIHPSLKKPVEKLLEKYNFI